MEVANNFYQIYLKNDYPLIVCYSVLKFLKGNEEYKELKFMKYLVKCVEKLFIYYPTD